MPAGYLGRPGQTNTKRLDWLVISKGEWYVNLIAGSALNNTVESYC